MESTDFDQVMTPSRAALDAIAEGSPAGYKALYSRGSDITLGNPLFGFARGWEEVVVFKGKMTARYADRDEVYEAGDAFFIPPGHVPVANEPGTAPSAVARPTENRPCRAVRLLTLWPRPASRPC